MRRYRLFPTSSVGLVFPPEIEQGFVAYRVPCQPFDRALSDCMYTEDPDIRQVLTVSPEWLTRTTATAIGELTSVEGGNSRATK